MKKTFTKFICILTCCSLLITGCNSRRISDRNEDNNSTNASTTVAPDKTNTSNESSKTDNSPNIEDSAPTIGKLSTVSSTNLEYESTYIKKHLEFIDGEKYKKIKKNPGGLAASMSKTYRESALDKINSYWKQLSTISLVLGSGEIEIKNEYMILVGALMQSAAAREAFNDNCQQAYLLAVKQMLSGISEVLSNADQATYFANPENLDKIDEIVKYIDAAQTDLDMLDVTGFKNFNEVKKALPGVNDRVAQIWDGAKEKLGLVFNEKDTKLLKGVLGGLGFAKDMAEIGSDSFSELMDEYLILSSCSRACDEYIETWKAIYTELNSNSDSESKKIAEALKDYLDKIEASKSDLTKQLSKKAAHAAGVNTIEWGLGQISDALDDLLDTHPILKGIRLGLTGGVKLSNYITNLDDTVYYGKMFMGGGIIAEAAYNVMDKASSKLVSDETFSNAILFDQAFNIYKNVQLATYDYGIDYCQSIATAPLGYVFKYTVDDEIVGADLLAIEKLLWSLIFCHFDTDVKNNGRPVVGLGSTVYYFENSKDSYESTGVNGYFSTKSNTYNNLIRLSGEEKTTILMTQGIGDLYIWNDTIYYQNNKALTCNSCSLDGEIHNNLNYKVIGASNSAGILVATSYENNSYTLSVINASGKELTLCEANNVHLLGFEGNAAYFVFLTDGLASFYKYEQDADGLYSLGQAKIAKNDSFQGIYFGSAVSDENAFYVTVGLMGGTGSFYSDGALIRVDFEDGVDTLISSTGDYSLDFTQLYLQKDENGNSKIYFGHNASFSNSGTWYSPHVSENVHSIDINSGNIQEEPNFTLCQMGGCFFTDGAIKSYTDNSGTLTTIMTKSQIESLGYKNPDNFKDPCSYALFAEVIDDYAYVGLRQLKLNESASIGWRQGYSLDKMGLYRVSLKDPTASIFTLYEFNN